MYDKINYHTFIQKAVKSPHHFSHKAYKALYNYVEDIEQNGEVIPISEVLNIWNPSFYRSVQEFNEHMGTEFTTTEQITDEGEFTVIPVGELTFIVLLM